MDELQISGKRFISSRRIARENGYTSDYIGQLIRGGKITGQKVGRAWYVEAASFDKYLGAEGPVVSKAAAVSEAEEISEAVVEEAPTVEVTEKEEEAVEEATAVETVEEKTIEPVVLQVTEEVAPEPVLVEETLPVVEVEKKSEPAIIRVQPEATHHVPLRIFRKEEKNPVKEISSGLRYYADDAPALPEIQSNKKESRITAPVSLQEEEGTVVVFEKSKRGNRFMLSGLVITAVAIFIFCAVVSSALSLNLSISEGNTATASYGLQW